MVFSDTKPRHSDENDGTLKTPQWIKMPTLLSSYHAGSGRESIDVQSGVYCCFENGNKQQQRTAIKMVVGAECILLMVEASTHVVWIYKSVPLICLKWLWD